MPDLIKHPSIIFVTGGRGEGKTALSHHIIEKFHNERGIKTYIVAPPKIHKKLEELLPKWIKIVHDIEECPENCLILIDESAIKYHCHRWQKKETEIMENLISISRHRKQTIIFVSHTLRKISITLLDGSILICKRPGLFHKYTERSGFKKLTELVEREFAKIPLKNGKKSAYVFSQQYKGFIHTPLPQYWSEELSEAYAGIDITKKEEETDMEEKEYLPPTIESGLKIWFKPEVKNQLLDILLCDGERLSEAGIICTLDKCHLGFDLKIGRNNKYYLSNGRFNLEENLKTIGKQKIPIFIDVESAYPLNREDVVFHIENFEKKEEKNELEEFAKKVEL